MYRKVALGVTVGLAWWFFWHVALDPKLFMQQMPFLMIHRDMQTWNPLLMIWNEKRRWVSLFWDGAYHRNLMWLSLFCMAIGWAFGCREKHHRTLLTILAGCMIGYVGVKKASWYIIWSWPFFMILIAVMLVEGLNGLEN